MTTYYITPIVGTGSKTDRFRSPVEDLGISYTPLIGMGTDGKPLPGQTWMLIAVSATANTTAIDSDPTIDKLPITDLNQRISQLTPAQRQTFQTLGTRYGVTRIAGLNNQNTCKEALVMFGQSIDPNFDASSFDVL